VEEFILQCHKNQCTFHLPYKVHNIRLFSHAFQSETTEEYFKLSTRYTSQTSV
jgi:hypothetical protein